MKILINGAYTIHSAGDDAALESLLSLIRRKVGTDNLETKVLCRHPNKEFDKAFGVETIQNLEYPAKKLSLNRWLRGFNFDDPPEILLNLQKEFEWADLVILGAGNFINENSFGLFRGMLPGFCICTFFSRFTNTPCMLYGLSASQLKTPLAIRMTNWLLNNVSKVTFRENISLEILRETGIKFPKNTEILPEPVLTSSSAPPDRILTILEQEKIPARTSRPRLAVSLREFIHRGREIHDDFLNRISGIVRFWVSNGGEVLFIPQCTYNTDQAYTDDRFLAHHILESLEFPDSVYVIASHYWPWEIEGLYSCCDVALCARLHGTVFSCKQAIPTIAFAYEPKVQGFCNQLGITEYSLPIDCKVQTILEQIERAILHFPTQRVLERIESLKKDVVRYADIAIELSNKKNL